MSLLRVFRFTLKRFHVFLRGLVSSLSVSCFLLPSFWVAFYVSLSPRFPFHVAKLQSIFFIAKRFANYFLYSKK